MASLWRPLQWLWRALWLDPGVYEEMRDDNNPFVEGAFLLVMLALLVSVAGLIGTLVEWAAVPRLNDIKEAVYQGLVQMSWYQNLEQVAGAAFVEQFRRQYDLGWRIFPALFGAPLPGLALARVVWTPAWWIVTWLAYGVLAHVVARLVGGQASLSQTLGVVALGSAPRLLNVASVVPFLSVGGVVDVWMLICRYMGLRIAHELSWPRALLAMIVPLIVLAAAAFLLAMMALVIAGPWLARLAMGG